MNRRREQILEAMPKRSGLPGVGTPWLGEQAPKKKRRRHRTLGELPGQPKHPGTGGYAHEPHLLVGRSHGPIGQEIVGNLVKPPSRKLGHMHR